MERIILLLLVVAMTGCVKQARNSSSHIAIAKGFASRGEADYGNKILSAMRKQFGGHAESG